MAWLTVAFAGCIFSCEKKKNSNSEDAGANEVHHIAILTRPHDVPVQQKNAGTRFCGRLWYLGVTANCSIKAVGVF